MKNRRALKRSNRDSARLRDVEESLEVAQESLRQAEADLAKEQAAVNRFRMHCRLQLGPWIEELQDVQTEKQRLLTRLKMWQQAAESGQPFDPSGWFENVSDDEEKADHAENHAENQSDEEGGRPIIDIQPSDRKAEKRLYRELARRFHPDLVEDALLRSYATSMMAAVNEAYENHDVQALRDLAGELDPTTVKNIGASGGGKELKRLQKMVRKCRQRERKVRLQHKSLREEMVARLWRKAQQIEWEEGENWWTEVAESFDQDISKIKEEIRELRVRLSNIAAQAPSADSKL